MFNSNVTFSNNPVFKSYAEVLLFFESQRHYVSLKYNNLYFKELVLKLNLNNWVDVENEYFEQLKKCKSKVNGNYDFERVEGLNSEFRCLKNELEKYLAKIPVNSNQVIIDNKFSRIFSELIIKDEVLLAKLDENILPNRIQILNFNYTSTIERSVRKINKIPIEINYIHGMLNSDVNPIIFGFGDEFDKDYKDFEDIKNNMLFEHIKSFGYFKAQNYHNLIRFLEDDDYQVYIVGHSCGLSDRTMLKEIFENNKCKSIKVFYYERPDGTNDFEEKTMEISRHFEDKGLMRKKIVSFPQSKKM
jgi:hypothetical protein